MDRKTTLARRARLARINRLPILTILTRLPRLNWPTRNAYLDMMTLLTTADRKTRPNKQTGISRMAWID